MNRQQAREIIQHTVMARTSPEAPQIIVDQNVINEAWEYSIILADACRTLDPELDWPSDPPVCR